MTNFELHDWPDGFFEKNNWKYVELAEFSEGDRVRVGDGDGDDSLGVVTAVMTEGFTFPIDSEEEEEIEASSDEPAYVVATVGQGRRVVTEDEISSADFPEIDASTDDIQEAELAEVYSNLDDPNSMEELINIRGVDDPHVGFDDWPPSWEKSEKPARLIALDAWSSLGGTFRTCRAHMLGRIRNPNRFCAAFKDEILGTERWRNRF